MRSQSRRKSAGEGSLAPGLYVTATPIGNARDVSLRALDVLEAVDAIIAEDTRVTAKLLAIHGIRRPLIAYNDHNAARERPHLLTRLKRGERLALVSDAGTPLVSDPGFKLVREAIAEGVPIHAIPGASAVLAGLTLAGLPTDRFLFVGFLSGKQGERRSALDEIKAVRATLIVFESAQRLAATLADMAEILGRRPAAVARELTKIHEEVRRNDLASLARDYANEGIPKGEVTILVAPAAQAGVDFGHADRLLAQALKFMPVRAAVDLVADALNAPRRALYERALALKPDE